MSNSFEGSEIFAAPPEKIFDLINNFELYKEFLPGCLESSRLPDSEEGNVMVGDSAKSLRVHKPERCAWCFKRYMGQNHEIEVGDYKLTPIELSLTSFREVLFSSICCSK